MADQPPAEFSDAQIDEWRRVRVERAQRPARAPRQRPARACSSLPLLVMAVATGLWLYTIALRDDRPSALAIWLHVVVERARRSRIVTAKVVESGGRASRAASTPRASSPTASR